MNQKKVNQLAYDQRLLDLYDGFAHGLINRRDFLERAAALAWRRTVEFFRKNLV